MTIPYIKGMSEAIQRVLAPLGTQTAMRSERIRWSVWRGIKDREDKTEVPGGCLCRRMQTVQGGLHWRNEKKSATED